MGRTFSLVVYSLLAASVLSVGTVVFRMYETQGPRYGFLVWNLFLAWVPLGAAALAFALARRGARLRVWGLAVVWLLFFPNAPYMLTDFIHLGAEGRYPLWYDGLMLSLFAWTALMLGFVSLYLMQSLIGRRAGAAAGWVVVVAVLGLSSVGVYIGRFVHFNSWDAVARPRHVLSVIQQDTNSPLHDPKMVAALLALTAGLFVGYLVVYAFSAFASTAPRRSPVH